MMVDVELMATLLKQWKFRSLDGRLFPQPSRDASTALINSTPDPNTCSEFELRTRLVSPRESSPRPLLLNTNSCHQISHATSNPSELLATLAYSLGRLLPAMVALLLRDTTSSARRSTLFSGTRLTRD